MVAVAAGLWTRRYLVILLFQALLALSIIVSRSRSRSRATCSACCSRWP